MAFWFSESHTDNVKLEIKVNEQLYSRMSDYQKIEIFQ
ncbi:MAG: spermidine synthase, partial [Clostridiales bacterium]|nr:spermidine synthase [Clostridiales bacterium]